MFLTRRFYLVALAVVLLLGSGYWAAPLFGAGQAALCLWVAATLLDAGLLYVGGGRLTGERHCAERFSNGDENPVTLELASTYRQTLRLTVIDEIPAIFRLMREERIPRICLYHLVYSGRGANLRANDLSHEETRAAVDRIIDETKAAFDAGFPLEVLTVDNHADAPYLWLRMTREGNPRADDVLRLLRMNGGNSSGNGLSCVSWDGTVYPDQFWRDKPLGNVRERPFGEIWGNPPAGSFLAQLREKQRHVKGRCLGCRFLPVCGGNFRARGEAATGDVWGEDPACYLTDEEIGGTL